MKTLWLVAILLVSNSSAAKPPLVTLRYSPVFDAWCSQQTAIDINAQERERLVSVFSQLQAAWNKVGPNLLEQTEALIQKPFLQSEMIGTVFLCKKIPSMSLPLLINGNWFIKADAQSPDLVADIIFHELIHTYLVDNFNDLFSKSRLLRKYKDEGPGVLAHLHLMAIQRKVYLSLGLKDRIEKVIKFDSESYKGAYQRSWEIVNAEGEEAFVLELK